MYSFPSKVNLPAPRLHKCQIHGGCNLSGRWRDSHQLPTGISSSFLLHLLDRHFVNLLETF